MPHYNDAQYMETPCTWNGYLSAPVTPHSDTELHPYSVGK